MSVNGKWLANIQLSETSDRAVASLSLMGWTYPEVRANPHISIFCPAIFLTTLKPRSCQSATRFECYAVPPTALDRLTSAIVSLIFLIAVLPPMKHIVVRALLSADSKRDILVSMLTMFTRQGEGVGTKSRRGAGGSILKRDGNEVRIRLHMNPADRLTDLTGNSRQVNGCNCAR